MHLPTAHESSLTISACGGRLRRQEPDVRRYGYCAPPRFSLRCRGPEDLVAQRLVRGPGLGEHQRALGRHAVQIHLRHMHT